MKIHRFIFYFLAMAAGLVLGTNGEAACREEISSGPIQLHSAMGQVHEDFTNLKADILLTRMAQAQDEGSGTESQEGVESDKSGQKEPASDKSDQIGSETDKNPTNEKGDEKKDEGKADKSASSKKPNLKNEGSTLYGKEGK